MLPKSTILLFASALFTQSFCQEPTIEMDSVIYRPDKKVVNLTEILQEKNSKIESLVVANLTLADHDLSYFCQKGSSVESLRHLFFDSVGAIPRLRKDFFKNCSSLTDFKIRAPKDVHSAELYENTFEDTQLTELAYQRMPLIFILSKQFTRGLKHLQKLWLADGYLTRIELGAFEGMNHLQVLNLEDNDITVLQPGTFEELLELHELYFKGNHLIPYHFSWGLFRGLPGLRKITLSDVPPGAVEAGLIRSVLPSIERVEIDVDKCDHYRGTAMTQPFTLIVKDRFNLVC